MLGWIQSNSVPRLPRHCRALVFPNSPLSRIIHPINLNLGFIHILGTEYDKDSKLGSAAVYVPITTATVQSIYSLCCVVVQILLVCGG